MQLRGSAHRRALFGVVFNADGLTTDVEFSGSPSCQVQGYRRRLAPMRACVCVRKGGGDTAGFDRVDCSARQGMRGRCMLPASGCLYHGSTCGEKPEKTLHVLLLWQAQLPSPPVLPHTQFQVMCQQTLPPTLWLVASHVIDTHHFCFPPLTSCVLRNPAARDSGIQQDSTSSTSQACGCE